jgi:hypothetical protein
MSMESSVTIIRHHGQAIFSRDVCVLVGSLPHQRLRRASNYCGSRSLRMILLPQKVF